MAALVLALRELVPGAVGLGIELGVVVGTGPAAVVGIVLGVAVGIALVVAAGTVPGGLVGIGPEVPAGIGLEAVVGIVPVPAGIAVVLVGIARDVVGREAPVLEASGLEVRVGSTAVGLGTVAGVPAVGKPVGVGKHGIVGAPGGFDAERRGSVGRGHQPVKKTITIIIFFQYCDLECKRFIL